MPHKAMVFSFVAAIFAVAAVEANQHGSAPTKRVVSTVRESLSAPIHTMRDMGSLSPLVVTGIVKDRTVRPVRGPNGQALGVETVYQIALLRSLKSLSQVATGTIDVVVPGGSFAESDLVIEDRASDYVDLAQGTQVLLYLKDAGMDYHPTAGRDSVFDILPGGRLKAKGKAVSRQLDGKSLNAVADLLR